MTAELLRPIFDPRLLPLGLRFTQGSLVDSSNGYKASATGNHLALYAEPIDASTWTVDDTVSAVAPLAAATAPYCFETWSGLDSYDICQEPPNNINDAGESPPVTQLELGRADALLIDWDDADLAALVGATLISPDTAKLAVAPSVAEHPRCQQAV
ncbi:MAG: hypothetical protein ACR2H3_12940, partial [Acidimicrobiales bacterium]